MIASWRTVLHFAAAFTLCVAASAADETAPQPVEPPAVVAPKAAEAAAAAPIEGEAPPLAWVEGVAAGKRRAQTEQQPILVRAGAPWCTWCERLKEQMELPAARPALSKWVLVDVNVDEDAAEACRLAVGPIPALRLLDARGRVVASRDGYLSAEELATWLRENYDKVTAPADDVLTGAQPPDADAAARLIDLAAQADPIQREAAVRRLLAHPAASAAQIVAAFRKGRLATRLAALEVLTAWHAPVADLDPWRPETLSADRFAALDAWARDRGDDPPQAARELSQEERDEAEQDIARLLAADDAAVDAVRERLSRYGAALAPLVTAQLLTATNDRDRERLQALRYRLVAPPVLVLTWPGGLERLASSHIKTRHDAAAELAARATPADERLLLELFKDPDPLVREISLRGLQAAGGSKSSGALASLLKDPEPNVRAAVLKQIAEQPAESLIPTIVAYVEEEQDADLVIHAIRVLKATSSSDTLDCLIKLFAHQSWQVRAEAAEAVGEVAHKSQNDGGQQADAYVALIGLLDDADSFVVSRALGSLKNIDLVAAVEPLAQVVDKHPDLAVAAVTALVEGNNMRGKALPHLRRYATHENPAVRAAVIPGLVAADADPADTYIVAALNDRASMVRQAGAEALIGMFKASRGETDGNANRVHRRSTGIWSKFGALFGGSTAQAERSEAGDAESWLVAYRAGKGRPEWMLATVEPLQKMLAADDRNERRLGALALIPLGHDAEALPVLKDLARTAPAMQGEIGAALAWLPREERRSFFDFLVSLKPKPEELSGIGAGLASSKDPRSADLLWGLLSAPDIDVESMQSIQRSLWTMYDVNSFLFQYGNAEVVPPAETMTETKRFATEGKPWQRTVALTLLLGLDASAAGDAAQTIVNEAQTPDEFRCDALQILLVARPRQEAEEAAAKELASDSPQARKVALKFLCHGSDALRQLRGHSIYLQSAGQYHTSYASEPESVAAPKGVTESVVRPLLDDADPEVAASAGYLLATLGERAGLAKLIKYWRGPGGKAWAVPVYRAIAALDDAEQVGTLTDIYAGLQSHEMRDFYWTIRTMHGAEILKLRKRIRDEVGMDQLR